MSDAEKDESVDGRSLRHQHRRGELLDAVLDYVLEHGVGEISLRPLASAVGVSHVTLRHHFGTKEELIAEILEVARSRQQPFTLPQDTLDIGQLLRGIWASWTEPERLRHFRFTFEAYGQALMHPDRYGRLLEHIVNDWLILIGFQVTALGCPPEDAPVFASLVLAQLRGLMLDLLTTGDRVRVERALAVMIEVYVQQVEQWRVQK